MSANPISLAVGDAILTFGWVFCASAQGAASSYVAAALQVQSSYIATMAITVSILFAIVFLFTILSDSLGGASFNPTATASFYSAGLGSDTLLSMAFRFPAQAAGALGGAMALREVVPGEYRHMILGPQVKVELQTAAIAEFVLTFAITFVVLIILNNGPTHRLAKSWLLAMASIPVITIGADYTGPSTNPANAYGWAYIDNWHHTWEQFYVYWMGPFAGAILAAWLYRAVLFSKVNKDKKLA